MTVTPSELRVLVAHNEYASGSPSGENNVVNEDIRLLRASGACVERLAETSDNVNSRHPLTLVNAAIGPVYSPKGHLKFSELAKCFNPDIVHLHNVFPLISPYIVDWAVAHGAKVVQTVHNYRHTCVNGLHFRNGASCDDCFLRRVPLPAIRHSCYRGSRSQSFAMAAGQVFHQRTWKKVDRFYVMSDFMADRLRAAGIATDRIEVRRTTASDPGEPDLPKGRTVLFAGRLEESKGVRLLLGAWSASGLAKRGWSLRIAGSGPEEVAVRDASSALHNVCVLGRLGPEEMIREFRNATVVAVPSLWYEGFPRVISEAFAHGRPVLASRLGSMRSEIDDSCGWLTDPSLESWSAVLAAMPDQDVRAKAVAARSYWKERLRPDKGAKALVESYRGLLDPDR